MESERRPVLVVELTRHLRGESQSVVGKNSRIRQSDISLIEQGRLIPTDDQLTRLAAALGLTFDSTPKSFLLEAVPEGLVPRLLSEIRRGEQPVPAAEPESVQ